MFSKIRGLRNFAMCTGKHPCWSLFLIKLQVLKTCNFIKKRLQHRCFPVKFAKFLRTPFFFTKHFRWLLLNSCTDVAQLLNWDYAHWVCKDNKTAYTAKHSTFHVLPFRNIDHKKVKCNLFQFLVWLGNMSRKRHKIKITFAGNHGFA